MGPPPAKTRLAGNRPCGRMNMYQADSVYKAPNGSFWPRAADFGSGAGQLLLGYTGRAANAAAIAALDPSQTFGESPGYAFNSARLDGRGSRPGACRSWRRSGLSSLNPPATTQPFQSFPSWSRRRR
jgi:hypothetical protein